MGSPEIAETGSWVELQGGSEAKQAGGWGRTALTPQHLQQGVSWKRKGRNSHDLRAQAERVERSSPELPVYRQDQGVLLPHWIQEKKKMDEIERMELEKGQSWK